MSQRIVTVNRKRASLFDMKNIGKLRGEGLTSTAVLNFLESRSHYDAHLKREEALASRRQTTVPDDTVEAPPTDDKIMVKKFSETILAVLDGRADDIRTSAGETFLKEMRRAVMLLGGDAAGPADKAGCDKQTRVNVQRLLHDMDKRLRGGYDAEQSIDPSHLIAEALDAELNRSILNRHNENYPFGTELANAIEAMPHYIRRKFEEHDSTPVTNFILDELQAIADRRAQQHGTALTTENIQAARRELIKQVIAHPAAIKAIVQLNLARGTYKTELIASALALPADSGLTRVRQFARALADFAVLLYPLTAEDTSKPDFPALLQTATQITPSVRQLGLRLFVARTDAETLTRLSSALEAAAKPVAPQKNNETARLLSATPTPDVFGTMLAELRQITAAPPDA